MSRSTWRTSIWRLFHREMWAIGLYANPVHTVLDKPAQEPFWIETGSSYSFLADPLLVQRTRNGKKITLLIAEKMNYLKGRGSLVFTELPERLENDLSWKCIERHLFHLSYPMMADHSEDCTEIWTESFETNAIQRYRLSDDLSQIQEMESLDILGLALIDPTPIEQNGMNWLFATCHGKSPNKDLFLFYSKPGSGHWQAHKNNPVKCDIRSSRPAGQIFRQPDGSLIRPAQDCSQTYGGALTLNKITELSASSFKEVEIGLLKPQENWPYPHGLHTLSSTEHYTAIDAKRWHFSLFEPFRQIAIGLYNAYRRKKLKTGLSS
ncbi:MAG: hypothetical protein MI743_17565 [Sneathiellales bacterium]|nr:hypothetical protein [Sneathiellales bacterium]